MPSVRRDLAVFGGYHSPQIDVEVRLNTNESPVNPSPEFIFDLQGAIADLSLNRYPDRTADRLRNALAEFHQVDSDEIFIANGSNEVISTLLLAYGGPGRKAMTFEPTYAMYSQVAKVTSTELVEVERNTDFQLEMAAVLEANSKHRPDIVFFCSPNNPTGLDEDPKIISKLAQDTNPMIVIDEAYGQFASFRALELATAHSNIVVSKTFSKVWSLAGLRLGYLIGPKEIISNLWAACLPYHLDAIKQAAGVLALSRLNDMQLTLDLILAGRDQIEAGFDSLDVFYWKSSANFILFRAPSGKGDELWKKLVDRSVLVRNCSGWPRLADCLRVTVGTGIENDRFLYALSEALVELRS
ncbi:MAG: histidinol-phosphate transaminase [Acidimicrobiaceae bacterium]|nr:histidinol-phosphate transaminase [Acidimicrobiaceae bacterium]